jgi:hypothetical protein
MARRTGLRTPLGLAAALLAAGGSGRALGTAALSKPMRGVLVAPQDVTTQQLGTFRKRGANTVAVYLADSAAEAPVRAAVDRIRKAGLAPYYWIEVGRCPTLAERHPEWMASLQGHPEWRRLFPQAPQPHDGEVVKNYPWVPVLYRETFAAHLRRIEGLLHGLPAVAGVFLNDLQAAPSACGCGNLLCRWTPDYGPIQTATRLPNDAAARFVAAVHQLLPASTVIPVWTTECEEGEKDASCAGVACFQGACWRDYTAQLMPVAKECDTLAALCLYRALGRDQPRYGSEAGWIRQALASFPEMPPKRGGRSISPQRVVAILQGWDVTPAQRQAQVRQCQAAGAKGYLMALTPIDQGWEPRIVRVPPQPVATPDRQETAPVSPR